MKYEYYVTAVGQTVKTKGKGSIEGFYQQIIDKAIASGWELFWMHAVKEVRGCLVRKELFKELLIFRRPVQ